MIFFDEGVDVDSGEAEFGRMREAFSDAEVGFL